MNSTSLKVAILAFLLIPCLSLRLGTIEAYDVGDLGQKHEVADLSENLIASLLASNQTSHLVASIMSPSERQSKIQKAFNKPGQKVLFGAATLAYLWYRSMESPHFTLNQINSFRSVESLNYTLNIGPVDIAALSAFSLAMFIHPRAGYAVYAINPARNVFVDALEHAFPHLRNETVDAEYDRNIISASFQAALALVTDYVFRGASSNNFVDDITLNVLDEEQKIKFKNILTVVMNTVSAGIWAGGIYKNWGDNAATQLRKVLLAGTLGTSEEIMWRQAYLADTSNIWQALIWGATHGVSGEGPINSPVLYTLLTFAYALLLGWTDSKLTRYLNHAGVEYLIMDNLIQEDSAAKSSQKQTCTLDKCIISLSGLMNGGTLAPCSIQAVPPICSRFTSNNSMS